MIKRAIVLLLLWAPLTALAAIVDSGWITISASDIQIINDGNGSPRAFIYVTVNNSGCTHSTPELIMDSTNPLATSMYATLMEAKATGQTVDIVTSGCSTIGYPIVISIHFQ
jgi:hypothetical protein